VKASISQSSDSAAALNAAFEAADAELLQYLESASSDDKLLTGAGATGSVILADLEKLVVANVGDSTAILVRNGQHVELTSAHRVYGQCVILPVSLQQCTVRPQHSRWFALGPLLDVTMCCAI
jgi:serine/threonine protein phosphatase PrpC